MGLVTVARQHQARGWVFLSLLLIGLTPILLLMLYLGAFMLWPETMINGLVEWIGTEISWEMRGLDQQEKLAAKSEVTTLLYSMFQNQIERERVLEVLNMMVRFRADQVFDEPEVEQFLTIVKDLNRQGASQAARQPELLLQVPAEPQSAN